MSMRKTGLPLTEMDVDGRTKPAFVTVKEFSHIYVDEKARNGRSEEQWKEEKDRLFYNQAEEMFRGRVFSSVYLIGEGFDREWAKDSLAFLCMKRHVFMGQNLYTKGACYSAMQRCRDAEKRRLPLPWTGHDGVQHWHEYADPWKRRVLSHDFRRAELVCGKK